jgi:hypothetical protein
MHVSKVSHPVLALSATSFALPATLPPAVVIDTEALSACSLALEADPSDAGREARMNDRARRAPGP